MSRPHSGILLLSLLLAGAACLGPRLPPAPEPEPVPEPEPEPPFVHAFVWTPRESLAVRTEEGNAIVPHLFTRLEVQGSDSLGLRVRCSFCREAVAGWVDREEVIYEAPDPHLAAHRELAEFMLALRAAAIELDIDLLRPVMAGEFIASYEGPEGPEEAFSRWRWERFRSLDHLPRLLDRGVATRDGRLWVSPPEFLTDPGYDGMRAGFRRRGDRWEWLFLVGGAPGG